jgi:hypothetical protein
LISEALFFYEGENVGLARWAKQVEMANCVVIAQLAVSSLTQNHYHKIQSCLRCTAQTAQHLACRGRGVKKLDENVISEGEMGRGVDVACYF